MQLQPLACSFQGTNSSYLHNEIVSIAHNVLYILILFHPDYRGAKQVLVTLGERGSLFVSSDSVTHEPSEKVKAIDTTGAGDCFLGSFAFFYARGEEVKSCMKKANHLAGVSVTRKGTQTSFPRRKELPDSLFQ
jgi:sugar/nucleoside kinase (ribokinase family)